VLTVLPMTAGYRTPDEAAQLMNDDPPFEVGLAVLGVVVYRSSQSR
jgi:hypothetical protein